MKPFKLSLPLQLLLIIGLTFFFGHYIPNYIKTYFYTISLQLQEILVFFLPFIIFTYLFSCLISFENNVVVFIISLMILVMISNFFSVMYAYSVGYGCLSYLVDLSPHIHNSLPLASLKILTLPKIPNNYALLAGLITGTFFFYFKNPKAVQFSNTLKKTADFFLKKLFIPLIPLFIFGFILKMDSDGLLDQSLKTYMPILLCVIVAQIIYIAFLYGIAAKFKFSVWKVYLRNVFPSAITAFSTMSSAATMPLVLEGAERNTAESSIVQACVPATINIHLIGDSIALPILMMATMMTFGHELPGFYLYTFFAGKYVLQKFAAAAVPGGGIILIMPLLQSILHFDISMQGFITALYFLFDPFVTVTNVTGNGALAIIFTNLFKKYNHK